MLEQNQLLKSTLQGISYSPQKVYLSLNFPSNVTIMQRYRNRKYIENKLMHCDCSVQQPRQTALLEMQSKPLNMVTEGVMESVRVNGVTVLSGLNLEKI